MIAAVALTRRELLSRPAAGARLDPGEDAGDRGFWVRVHRRMMACRVEIVLPGERADQVPIARVALDDGDRLEELMTIFRQTSELVRVNRLASSGPVTTEPELFEVLARSQRIHRETGGAFDATATALSRCWGFLRREGRLPAEGEIERARGSVGMQHVDLDAAAHTVAFRVPGIELNLGSIGKGFALDRMGLALRTRGVRDALLSAGASSVLAIGGPWPIDLWSTVHGDRLARVRLSSGALGTSGAGEQFFEVDGIRYGHVIDPRSGWPARGVLSASVVTTDAATADALSTAFLIGGVELAARYCEEHPDVLALVTPDDGSRTPVTVGAYSGVTLEHS
jgi:thiamine biosynthesis lipoprotein